MRTRKAVATTPVGSGNVVVPAQDPHAPFGPEFQGMLFKLLLTDQFFARALADYISPTFFQNEALAWCWATALEYRKVYDYLPSPTYLFDAIRRLEPGYVQLYGQVLSTTMYAPLTDEVWLRSRVVDWIKRNIFRQAYADCRDLFAAGEVDKAYDIMQQRLDTIRTANLDVVDRGWLAEEFVARQANAQQRQMDGHLIGIGIPQIDQLLGGGAYPGFLGTWIAYPKAGKTTFLVNIGVTTMRAYFKRVLHVVLEGSREIVETRYDSLISNELYAKVKSGDMDAALYANTVREMQYLKGLCVVRGFVENWETNVIHIEEELKALKQEAGWVPDTIIVDYADLMRARALKDATETQHQIQAYKELKTLMGRGYRGWTASQVQRPKDDDYAEKPHLLYSKNIADAYAKVRICDLIGSINQTNAERQQGVMRLFVEMFRDGPANLTIPVQADFQKMQIGGGVSAMQTAAPMGAMQGIKPFGYVAGNGFAQMKNGV